MSILCCSSLYYESTIRATSTEQQTITAYGAILRQLSPNLYIISSRLG